jgi:diguanylate cyclase (GGDEF)-like protein
LTVRRHPVRVLLIVAAAVVAAAVWLGAEVQRDSATAAAKRMEASQRMLSSLLDQESGLRGYQLTGAPSYLSSSTTQRATFAQASNGLTAAARHDDAIAAALTAVDAAERRWRAEVDRQIAAAPAKRAGGAATRPAPPTSADNRSIARHDQLVTAFRANIARLQRALDSYGDADQRASVITTVVLSLLSFVTIALTGGLWLRRRVRAEARALGAENAFREEQTEFARALLSVASEDEAHDLLKRHLERDGRSTVTVLNLNNSHDRLDARTTVDPESSLALHLRDASPRSCIAVRQGTSFAESATDHPLLRCDVCGASGQARLCAPLLVSGEVIGSVLNVMHAADVSSRDRRRVDEAVTIAAPVLANLRTIALAESRAATDALTGLPNRRSFNDTLKRMLAQSLRSHDQLSVIAIDLDHFKQINDRFGHDKGDEVLATAAAALREGTRASDFVGRWGGEEFVVIAPDTPLDGALALAENLRAGIERMTVVGVDRELSASFGVAVSPAHAASPELLVRQADRALYAAKALGRNCVQVASATGAGEEPAPAPTPA